MTGKKILIVEDHKDSCLWISAVLRQSGYATVEAGDGTLALRMVRSERPDLMLLDLHLPAGGGHFVLESLRKQPEFRDLPVIIMSGDTEMDEQQLTDMGAVGVFRKPMDVHAFLKTVRKALATTAEDLLHA